MRLLEFDFQVEHVSGKNFYGPDALSRAPLSTEIGEPDVLEERLLDFIVQTVQVPQVSDQRLRGIKFGQEQDSVIKQVKLYVTDGWPYCCDMAVRPYRKYQNDFWVKDELLLFRNRIVIPQIMRREILDKIHEGHGGEKKCIQRAEVCVWWPGITRDIKDKVASCRVCLEHRTQRPEPLITTPLPTRPWEMLGMDHFKYGGRWYIVVADYFSRYPEVVPVRDLSTAEVIRILKGLFAKFGIPERIRCDCGGSLTSYEVEKFGKQIGFQLVTSSPKYPQSNGFSEAMVKVAKEIVAKGDLDLGLLAYRTTPLEQGYSPAELLMGRKLRGTLPIIPESLRPRWPSFQRFKTEDRRIKHRNKECFDRRHAARPLRDLQVGERVWIQDRRQYGTVLKQSEEAPRRYVVQGPDGGRYERNRRMLLPLLGRKGG